MSHKPRYKIIKQTGQNIFATDNVKEAKNNNRQRVSLFGQLLKHKNIVRKYYGNLTKKQLTKIFQIAKTNATYKNNPILVLEHRLDVLLVRLNWVTTIFAAKQLILHGHVLVNGRKITHQNYLVEPGQVIQIKKASAKKRIELIHALLKQNPNLFKTDVPNYLEVSYPIMSAILLYSPSQEEIPYPVKINPNTIKQLYQI